MTTNLLQSNWTSLDPAELRLILYEHIGGPGQYDGFETNPYTFYLPRAREFCRIKLTFSPKTNEIVAIERGPAFDHAQWEGVVHEIESPGSKKIGRGCSFSSFRVLGGWRGHRSGLQILPPPTDAPKLPYAIGEHPFILEYPLREGDLWQITNFRRMREHRRFTFLLNILLAGHTTIPPRRSRHLWAAIHEEGAADAGVKWVQEFYFANIGDVIQDGLSQRADEAIEEIDPESYYAQVGHDGGPLRVPADLDDSICCYIQLSKANREKFDRAGFWMDMASRQWTDSLSASFASLVIAVEALGERSAPPSKRFHDFLEKHAQGATPERRTQQMYDLRSFILHEGGLIAIDQGADFGWSPPEFHAKNLLDELWELTQRGMRNWLRNPV